jgi:protein SCO1/2
VRGRFLGTTASGREVVLHHEAIPGVMPSMVMTLPLRDTTALDAVQPGAAVVFDLVTAPTDVYVTALRPLPDTVRLDLPARDSLSSANGRAGP